MPAVLRLAQTVMHGRWRAMGEDLYREVASLARARVGVEILVSGCRDGVTAVWLAARTGAAVTGLDPDAARIARAETRARATAGVAPSYEVGPLDDLPHENAVFDAAIGEPSIASAGSPARAVAELVRVTRPMGHVVILLPTWSSDVPGGDREAFVERLGLRPYLLVEWKQMLRDAGAVEVVVQDWSDGGPAARASGNQPTVPQLTWRQKAHIAARALRRRGLRAARMSVQREAELLQELAHSRAIGFHLISGVKWAQTKQT
ncbi:MAG TPA: methyltransferase domain-containing protein [Gemmatimonadaceae bacterium]|nr:methyltransferase domain-containing protein [Gemmatimonadaceae bacterium]